MFMFFCFGWIGFWMIVFLIEEIVRTEIEIKRTRKYFEGQVVVQYRPSTNDKLIMTFNERGEYHIAFSLTPEKVGREGRGAEALPQDLTVMVEQVPHEQVLDQAILPDYLRVTITRDGVVEHYDFA